MYFGILGELPWFQKRDFFFHQCLSSVFYWQGLDSWQLANEKYLQGLAPGSRSRDEIHNGHISELIQFSCILKMLSKVI